MADISLIQDDSLDDSDEGVFEQGDGPSGGQVDDDSLPPLLRIQKYALSENVFDRQMVPRVLLELFRTGPADQFSADLPHIMNIVSKLAEEDENKRFTYPQRSTVGLPYELSIHRNSVRKLIDSTVDGKIIAASYSSGRQFMRSKLCELIIKEELKNNPSKKIPSSRFIELADEINQVFLHEAAELYFVPYVKNPEGSPRAARGKLYSTYIYMRKNLKALGLITASAARDNSGNDTQARIEENEDVQWLKNNATPFTEVIEKWRQTTHVRITNFPPSILEYVQTYPGLSHPQGYTLFEIDFENLHPTKVNFMFSKWVQLAPKILRILENRNDAYANRVLAEYKALDWNHSYETMVRTDLLEQLPNLAATAAECTGRVPELTCILSDYLLPLVVRNLGTSDNQVRKTAHSTLFVLMEKGLVNRQQAEMQVCPTVLSLSNMESIMDCHTGAVTLMSRLAPFLGRDVTERVFLQRFSQLCANHMFYVRKVCASHFGDFCAVIGKEAYEHTLLPCYIALCADDIWGVRKACAEVVMSVSCACPPIKRRSALAPVFARLLQDQSRWVRMSAFQTLGPFISTFADPTITSLAYNSVGELVLVNNDGTEFRISPTYTDTNILRSVGELRMLYQFQERGATNIDEEQQNCVEKDEDDDIIFNPLNDLENGSDGDCKEIRIDNVALELEVASGDDVNLDEANIATNSGDFMDGTDLGNRDGSLSDCSSTWQFEDNILNCVNLEMEEDDNNTPPMLNIESNESEDIKEIVETVKNAVLSFRNNESNIGANTGGEYESSNTNNVIDEIQYKSCDNLDKCTTSQDGGGLSEPVKYKDLLNNEERCYVLNESLNNPADDELIISGDSEINSVDDDNDHFAVRINGGNSSCPESGDNKLQQNLEQFNSYNYWYISPEMPLDPSIINAEPLSPKQDTSRKILNDRFTNMEHFDSFSSANLSHESNSRSLPYPKMDKIFTDKFSMYLQRELNRIDKVDLQDPGEHQKYPTNNSIEPPQHIVPQLLIDHFVSMTDPNLAQNTDNEMAYHCAYSLPAVALTLGSKNWHLLKDTVEVLAANMQYKVRRTVASSLHELAMILGPDIATNNLTPIFEGFIKDLDEVRIGVLKHLAHFLRLISPSKRNIYLPRLAEFLQSDNEANWRFRQELAEQLLLAVPLFRPGDATKHISTLAQELLCDKVAAVREVALLLVSELIRHISADQSLTSRLLVKLAEKFAHSKRWKLRQSFALLCSEILTSQALAPEQFASEVMPHLLDLSWDPVPNVRLVVARTISQHIVTNEYFTDVSGQHYDGLQTVLRRLQSDKDRDVRQSAVFQKLTNVQ